MWSQRRQQGPHDASMEFDLAVADFEVPVSHPGGWGGGGVPGAAVPRGQEGQGWESPTYVW